MANINLKDTLDISFKTIKRYIDDENEKKADKVDENELYVMLERVFAGQSDAFGYVDENNDIVLKEDLVNGTYTLKYENENGTYTDIKILNISNEEV